LSAILDQGRHKAAAGSAAVAALNDYSGGMRWPREVPRGRSCPVIGGPQSSAHYAYPRPIPRKMIVAPPLCCHRPVPRIALGGAGGEQMLYSFRRNHASVPSVGKKTKRLIAIVGFTLLASHAFADPQSEISGYRKSYGLSAVTVDPKLTELARQQANAMAERRSLDHNVYASLRSRMASYGAASVPKISRWGPGVSGRPSRYGNPRPVIMRICSSAT